MGIDNMNFNIPINFASFFGEFMEDFSNPQFMPLFDEVKKLKCNNCGYTFDDIISTGKLGCGNCYDVFENRLDNIIKKIQGSNKHVGRLGKIIDDKIDKKIKEKEEPKSKMQKEQNDEQDDKKVKDDKLKLLQEELKAAIKDERYEDAAKIRDEIKNLS